MDTATSQWAVLLLQAAQIATYALLPAVFGALLLWLRQRGYRTDVLEAIGRGAGYGYGRAVARNMVLTDPSTLRFIAEQAAGYALATVPAKAAAVGVDQHRAELIASAETGRLLASGSAAAHGLVAHGVVAYEGRDAR